MKLDIGQANISFQNMGNDKERLDRLSRLIIAILDNKMTQELPKGFGTKDIRINEISLPKVALDSTMTDQAIAEKCATAIFQSIVSRLG